MLWSAIRSQVLIEMEGTNDVYDHLGKDTHRDQKPVLTHQSDTGDLNSATDLEPDSENEDEQTSQISSHSTSQSGADNCEKTVIRFVYTQNPNYTALQRGRCKHFACRQCPATDTYKSLIETHIKLHEEGSGAIPCQICGWLVMPKSMPYHYGKRHPEIPKIGRKLKKHKQKRYHNKCPDCSALLTSIGLYRNHEELHKNGNGHVCKKCGWLTKKLTLHKGYWHNPNRIIPKREIKVMDKDGWETVTNLNLVVVQGKSVGDTKMERKSPEKTLRVIFPSTVPLCFLILTTIIAGEEPEPVFFKNGLESLMKLRDNPWKTPIWDVDDSEPNFTKYYRGNTRYFGCRLCATEDSYPSLLEEHMKLHKGDSGAVPCSICGWMVMPNKLTFHFGKHHKTPEEKREQNKNLELFYYQCPNCSALLCSIGKYREHAQMHENGEGVICEKKSCGWLVKGLPRHVARWHPTGSARKIKHTRQIKLMRKESNAN